VWLIAVLGLLAAVVLSGGAWAALRARKDRRVRGAVRLLSLDCFEIVRCLIALIELESWWDEQILAPTLDDWPRFRGWLVKMIEATDWQTVDDAFYQVRSLESARRAGLDAREQRDQAQLALVTVRQAAWVLAQRGFSRSEMKRASDALQAEMARARDAEDSETTANG
jgi:hypothetical protein